MAYSPAASATKWGNPHEALFWSTAAPSLLRFVPLASDAGLVASANVAAGLLLRGPPIGLVALVARPSKGQNDGLCGRGSVLHRGHEKEEIVACHVIQALDLTGRAVPRRLANLNVEFRTNGIQDATYELLVQIFRRARQMKEQRSSGHLLWKLCILRGGVSAIHSPFSIHSRPR